MELQRQILLTRHPSRPVHPALLKVYANSSLNTSPPFSLPFQAQELESQFKRKASDLHGATSSLETETRETFAKAGKSKRFEAFVKPLVWFAESVRVEELPASKR